MSHHADQLDADEIVLAAQYADAIAYEQIVELGSGASLDRSPRKNWVENSGDLPRYVREIARSIEKKRGMPLSRAIPIAIGTVKRWARGGDNVNADTRAKALKAVAEWEALKAKNKARMAKKVATSDTVSEAVELSGKSNLPPQFLANAKKKAGERDSDLKDMSDKELASAIQKRLATLKKQNRDSDSDPYAKRLLAEQSRRSSGKDKFGKKK